MSTETRTRITVQEFEKLDNPRYTQLIDGEIVLNAPKRPHQLLVLRIVDALHDWTKAGAGRGMAWLSLEVEIDQHNLYEPDVLWASHARMAELRDDQDLVPDLCVEVRSPSTWRYDVGIKKAKYEQRGLPELWVVDTKAESVLVYRRSNPHSREFDVTLQLARAETLTSALLPGFAYELEELFTPLRPPR
ncbi:MAG: Uma2 family endonuclease [Solirubrobacterales bacterium]|nr:MAG: Uma2 family endonuclease [Solirubrobacterales bacterium]